ncbi:MAG: DegT/DnrJ/EryC1/StrS family aminotransferase [Thaumarchaeota archaeon]|nr:DegT/DnrJ/EryC1/StrS family aminotransferase [Nitrososphaerota archaeon]
MSQWKIPLFKMHYDENDGRKVLSVLKRGMYWGLSSETIELEKKVAEKTDRKYCVVFNSATSALHALMISYKFSNRDEIILPSFTFIASSNSVMFVNATPRFADIEDSTYGLDPHDVESKITKKTKAIMPVHYAGNICKINEIRKIASDYKLTLIEDAATALGSKINGKSGGSFGDASVISFAWNKIITSGEGGAAVTDSRKIYEDLIRIRSHGRIDTENYFMSANSSDYTSLGYNWRMSAMTAALGISQIDKLEKLIKMRNNNAAYLTKLLSNVQTIESPVISNDRKSNFMLYTVKVREGRRKRDELHSFMTKKGIQTKIIYEPIHLTSFYRRKFGYKKGLLKNTERIADKILSLPMYPHLKKTEMNYIIESIKEFFEREG